MSQRFSIEIGTGGRTRPGRASNDREQLRILVLGDFSGRRGSPDHADIVNRRIVALDVDSFDAAMRRISPRLAPPISGAAGEPAEPIEFSTLEDFHPGRLYRTVPAFRALRRSRSRLLDPATFESEAAALMAGGSAGEDAGAATPPDKDTSGGGVPEPATATLERLLGSRPAGTRPEASESRKAGLPERLLRGIVEPYVVRNPAAPDPYVAALDAAASDKMRALIHDPGFRELEAAWRSLRFLLDSIDGAQDVEVCLLDVSKQELLDDAAASAGRFADSAICRRLLPADGGAVDDRPWSMILGNFAFGAVASDLALLARLGAIGSLAGAPFLAAAEPSFIGCADVANIANPRAWRQENPDVEQRLETLRHSEVAQWVALAFPGFLLRLPYGPATDPVEEFHFEELTSGSGESSYLWANPAFACALVAARAMNAGDAQAPDFGLLEISDLPAHVSSRDGETELRSCSEHLLGLQAAEAMRERGVIPLVGFRQRNAVRVGGLYSIAPGPTPLAGIVA